MHSNACTRCHGDGLIRGRCLIPQSLTSEAEYAESECPECRGTGASHDEFLADAYAVAQWHHTATLAATWFARNTVGQYTPADEFERLACRIAYDGMACETPARPITKAEYARQYVATREAAAQ